MTTTTDVSPATDPVQAEALGATQMSVVFDGLTFTAPRDLEDWPAETMLAMEEGKAATAIKALVPAKQWAAFMAGKPPIRKVAGLLDAIAVEAGFKTAGE